MKTIAIIPARSGSKRIFKKNIKAFLGIPIISYVISAAKHSKLFDSIVVTTDDEAIGTVAIDSGANQIIMRPEYLACDETPTVPVIVHAIDYLSESCFWDFNAVCCLYPTAVFTEPEDLSKALLLLKSNPSRYIFPIAKLPTPIERSLGIDEYGVVQPLDNKSIVRRTQLFQDAYYDTGQFYWASKDTWRKNTNIFLNSIGYQVPLWKGIDINTEEDWALAELLFKLKQGEAKYE